MRPSRGQSCERQHACPLVGSPSSAAIRALIASSSLMTPDAVRTCNMKDCCRFSQIHKRDSPEISAKRQDVEQDEAREKDKTREVHWRKQAGESPAFTKSAPIGGSIFHMSHGPGTHAVYVAKISTEARERVSRYTERFIMVNSMMPLVPDSAAHQSCLTNLPQW